MQKIVVTMFHLLNNKPGKSTMYRICINGKKRVFQNTVKSILHLISGAD